MIKRHGELCRTTNPWYTVQMLKIEIEIQRPWMTLALLLGLVVGVVAWSQSGVEAGAPVGGDGTPSVVQTEKRLQDLRGEQQVLDHREEILRSELAALEVSDTSDADQLSATRKQLIALLQDRRSAEVQILQSLHELWDAEGDALSMAHDGVTPTHFEWSVAPRLGISAHFEDAAYKQRFGFSHHAIDIPTPQGTIVRTVADGVVAKVNDQGKGFSSIVIAHGGGLTTLYGHVSGFLVSEGEQVLAGDAVALSGGMPGTNGAGHLTTGAHLHLAFMKDGVAVDPLPYLPEYP